MRAGVEHATMVARYYDGKIGRFTSVDPVYNAMGNEAMIKAKTGMKLQQLLENPQALNSYSYSYNNPLIYRDQSGEFAFLAPIAAYAVAYAPVWVPAAITTVSAIGAGVTSWFMGESVGYMMEGNHQAASQSLDKAHATLGATAIGVGGIMAADSLINSSQSTPKVQINQKNENQNIHANCLNCTKENTGYTLRDKATGEIMKYGETTRPQSRYSQTYLNKNNVELKPEITGNKSDIHQWQHNKIIDYKQNNNGQRPVLNKSDW